MASAAGPRSRRKRSAISSAALLVKVTAQIRRRRDAGRPDQVPDAADEAEGLAGSRPGDHEHGAEGRFDGALLGDGRLVGQVTVFLRGCRKGAVRPRPRQAPVPMRRSGRMTPATSIPATSAIAVRIMLNAVSMPVTA